MLGAAGVAGAAGAAGAEDADLPELPSAVLSVSERKSTPEPAAALSSW